MFTPIDFLPFLNIVLVVCLTVGGLFAFRNGRQTQLAKLQKDTNDTLQQRISALEGKIADFEKENAVQRHIIDTITSALKQRGVLITIDGDLVTITDQNTGVSSSRKRPTPHIKRDPAKENQ